MAANYVGTPGRFTLSDPGSTVTGYWYGYSSGAEIFFVQAGSNGTATLAITPFNDFEIDLSVQAVNGSSLRSAESQFKIDTIIAPGNVATLAWWKLNAGHGATAADSTGHLHGAMLAKDASLSCATSVAPDGFRCSLKVGGRGGQARTRPALLPVIGNNDSFSVSAWAHLSACASSCAAFSADAMHTDAFALGYQHSCTAAGKTGACWTFSMPVADSSGVPVPTAASAPGSAKLGKWTQLTGVFDATHGTLTLYVNGIQAGQVSQFSPWAAPGNGRVRIGNLFPGGKAADWKGRLSNICAFFGVLQPSDVMLLHKGDAAHPHNGCAALFVKYP